MHSALKNAISRVFMHSARQNATVSRVFYAQCTSKMLQFLGLLCTVHFKMLEFLGCLCTRHFKMLEFLGFLCTVHFKMLRFSRSVGEEVRLHLGLAKLFSAHMALRVGS